MRKTTMSKIASVVFAANTENVGNVPSPDETKTETGNVPVTEVPEKAKGKIGTVNPAMQAQADRENELVSNVLKAKDEFKKPANDLELKGLIHEQSLFFKEIGDNISQARVSSAKLWPVWENLCPMEWNKKSDKLDLGKFCKAIWNMLEPEVKLADPMKPNTFFPWAEARKYGNSAAMTIENIRNYVRNNKERLYPQFFPEVEKKEAVSEGVAEELAPLKKAKREIEDVLKLPYLPKEQYVMLNEKGEIAEGAKPVTLAELLRGVIEEINSHLPKEETKQEKAEKNYEAELAELKEEKERLAQEKAELEKEKARLEKQAKHAEKSEKK
jgi:hypothetical protein